MKPKAILGALALHFLVEQAASVKWSHCWRLKAVGNCKSKISAWYYDIWSLSCKGFTYSGCGGNANRFRSEEECQKACTFGSKVKKVCSLVPKPGNCTGFSPSWYYDAEVDVCRGFIYGGCYGNANRFTSCKACMKRCSGKRNANKICKKQTAAFRKRYNLGLEPKPKKSRWPFTLPIPFLKE
uniref:BPTI/Kunitz inhibitor domain-containing protein n=1 Tax=Amblyomma maculatum TaxID=34609 RepID=G3MTV7_AMBMU